jgi:LysR family glycine cleavage system transcriptional activator
MRSDLNLNWLRTFEAAARHLSFTASSHELGLTQTAVSQHIKSLEVKLGHKLFNRRAKSVQLTDIGQAYLLSVRDALEQIEFSTNGLFGPGLKSTIVVRGSMAFIIWLSPQLSSFQGLQPDVRIKLITSLWQSDLDANPVDVDVILAPQNQSGSHLQKLSDECIVPVCSPKTAQRIQSPHDLTTLDPIHVLGFDDHWARYLVAFDLDPQTDAHLVVDTSVAACELAEAPNRCAIMIERFAQQAVRSGRPIKIAGEPVPIGQAHFLSRRKAGTGALRARDAFCDWLQTCF